MWVCAGSSKSEKIQRVAEEEDNIHYQCCLMSFAAKAFSQQSLSLVSSYFNFFSPVEWASLRMCLLFFPSLSGAGSMIGVVTSGPGHFQSHRHTGAQCYTEKTFYFLVCNIYLCVFSTGFSIEPDCLFHLCQSCLCWEKRYISTPLITCSRVNNASVVHSRGANQLLHWIHFHALPFCLNAFVYQETGKQE